MTTQYLAIFFFLSYRAVHGLPVLSRAELPSLSPLPESSSKRNLMNIIWSCLSTIIICAWVSVHPNVPPSGHWRTLRQRLEMMFWTVIAPELILAWAVRQWFAAWEIRDTVNGTREGDFLYSMHRIESNNRKGLLTGLLRAIKRWFGEGDRSSGEICLKGLYNSFQSLMIKFS